MVAVGDDADAVAELAQADDGFDRSGRQRQAAGGFLQQLAPGAAEEIRDAAGAMVQVVEGARTNAYGALAMSIPAEGLKAGRFAGRLYRGGALVADYRFEVVR